MHVILVHGWKGWPENAWFPWLRKQLEARGDTTEALKLPKPVLPDRVAWSRMIREAIPGPDTILVGHSMGCPAILWALEEYGGPAIAQVVCVSGFGRPFFPVRKYRDLWFPRPVNFDDVRSKARAWSVIHSSMDPLVPFREGKWLAERLGVPVTVTKRVGHLAHEELAFEVPEILDAIL